MPSLVVKGYYCITLLHKVWSWCNDNDVIILYSSHMHTRRPRNCPDEIADVMSRCHMHKRNERITFEQIVEEFSKEDILKLMGEKEIEISGVY